MRVNSLCQGLFLLFLLFEVGFCSGDDKAVFEAVGTADCADCKENNLKTSQAFSGLRVSIDCKLKNGDMQRIGASELDKDGNFKISLPKEIVEDGKKLKQECYAQLHSAAAIPCPAHNGLEASKIVLKSQTNGKVTFGPTQNVQFSTALCTSKFLWPFPKSHHPWKKHFPKVNFPPLKNFGHPWPLPPFPPLYKPKPKPLPPHVPIYKPLPPPVPIYKPLPPHVPIYKPLPPPVPIYKPKPKPKPKPPVYVPPVIKPLPPPIPIYKPKPKPPVYKPPVVKPPVYKPPIVKPLPPPIPIYKPKPKPPIYKLPVITKPLPPPIPLHPLPPFYKKPCPPLPKLPPFPKIHPKYFHHHHKFGYFPPLPPSIPHA